MPGPRSHFRINKHRNPNTGGGCACSPDAKVTDCVGPFVIFTHKEQFVSRNPYVVVGSGCAKRMAEGCGVMPEPVVVLEAADPPTGSLADATVAELSQALTDKLRAPDAA